MQAERPPLDGRAGLRRRLALLALSAALCLPALRPAAAEALDIQVSNRAFSHFALGSDRRVFGKLEFLGGIGYSSGNPLLGAISAIRFREDRQHFVAVLDTGHWLTGRVERSADGLLSGLADLEIRSMFDKNGEDENVKFRMDAEGLAIAGGELLVSFEVFHRIDAYPDPGFMEARPSRKLPLPFDRR